MAARPWVTPDEVRGYSGSRTVQSRTDGQLSVDIARAEQYVITYTHNDFSDYEEVPEAVKLAVLLLAESYSRGAAIASKGVKSETFDDYSYTAADELWGADELDLAALLDDYVKNEATGTVTMRMRRL